MCHGIAAPVSAVATNKNWKHDSGLDNTQRHLESFFRACGYLLSSRLSTLVRPLQMTSSSTVCPGGYSSVICRGVQVLQTQQVNVMAVLLSM